jgi:hypothetical protein
MSEGVGMGPLTKGLKLAFGWIGGRKPLSPAPRIGMGPLPEGGPYPRKWVVARAWNELHGEAFLEPCPPVTDEQLQRRERSHARLESEGVPTLAWHSLIESESEIEPRQSFEVANRLRALCVVSAKASAQGIGLAPAEVMAKMKRSMHVPVPAALFTPDEAAFLPDLNPSRADVARFSWRCEAAWVLLWALRWVDGALPMPLEPCDSEGLAAIVRGEPDLTARGLRPLAEILDEADLIYRYAWAVRSALNAGVEPPAGLNRDVIMERHHALNWLIRYEDAEWDEIGCDT